LGKKGNFLTGVIFGALIGGTMGALLAPKNNAEGNSFCGVFITQVKNKND